MWRERRGKRQSREEQDLHHRVGVVEVVVGELIIR